MKINRLKKTSYGNILIELTNAEDVNKVVTDWKPDFFGNPAHPDEKTRVEKMTPKKISKPQDGIIKHVETSISEQDVINSLEVDGLKDASCTRFKKGNVLLNTIKISFGSADDLDTALKSGIFIGDRHFPVVEYSPRRRPMQCFKCNKFGHPMKWCRSKRCCEYCASQDISHGPDSACPVMDVPNRHSCSNCEGNHGARATTCPIFKERMSRLNSTPHYHGLQKQ